MIAALPWLFAAWSSTSLDAACACAHEDASAPAREDVAAIVQRGQAHYAAEHFAEAAAAFAQAYEIDPTADVLYRWAQSERRAGNCPIAVQLYRRYLQHDLPPENAEAANKNLARCGHVEPGPDPIAEGPAPAPAPDEPAPARPTESWARDPLGASLVAIGGAGLVAAAVLAGGYAGERNRARDATLEPDYARHADRSRKLATGAIATSAIGAALLVAGIVRWSIVKKRQRRVAIDPLGIAVRF